MASPGVAELGKLITTFSKAEIYEHGLISSTFSGRRVGLLWNEVRSIYYFAQNSKLTVLLIPVLGFNERKLTLEGDGGTRIVVRGQDAEAIYPWVNAATKELLLTRTIAQMLRGETVAFGRLAISRESLCCPSLGRIGPTIKSPWNSVRGVFKDAGFIALHGKEPHQPSVFDLKSSIDDTPQIEGSRRVCFINHVANPDVFLQLANDLAACQDDGNLKPADVEGIWRATLKPCPYCSRDIRQSAVFCRHCEKRIPIGEAAPDEFQEFVQRAQRVQKHDRPVGARTLTSEDELIRVTCPSCGHKLRAKRSLGGLKGRCPNKECRAVISVPAPADASPSAGPGNETKKPRRLLVSACVVTALVIVLAVTLVIRGFKPDQPANNDVAQSEKAKQRNPSIVGKPPNGEGAKDAGQRPEEADESLPRDGPGDPALTYEVVSKNPGKYRGRRVTWSFAPCSTENETMLCSLYEPAARKPGADGMYLVRFASIEEASNGGLLMAGFSGGSTITGTVAGEVDTGLVQRDRLGVVQDKTPKAKLPMLLYPVYKLARMEAAPVPLPEKKPVQADWREQILGEWADVGGDKTLEFSDGGTLTIGDRAPDRKSVISARYQFLDDGSLQIDVLRVGQEASRLELPPWGTRDMAVALLDRKEFTIKVQVAFAEGQLSVTSENGKAEYRRMRGPVAGPVGKPEPLPDPTGTWIWMSGRLGLPRRKNRTDDTGQLQETSLRLTLEGDSLAGVIFGSDGLETPVEDAAFRNGYISFRMTREVAGYVMIMKYTGRVSGDTIKGEIEITVKGEMAMKFNQGKPATREWDAKRAKD